MSDDSSKIDVLICSQLADVRILALGVTQHALRKPFQVNPNAAFLLHPPVALLPREPYPVPSVSHKSYLNYTPGGQDSRWATLAALEDGSRVWVGSLMSVQIVCCFQRFRNDEKLCRLVAQLINPCLINPDEENSDLVVGPGRSQYSSFTWPDLWAIAPWMADKVTKRIEGPGLGID